MDERNYRMKQREKQKRKAQRRKKQKIQKMIVFLFILLAFLVGIFVGQQLAQNKNAKVKTTEVLAKEADSADEDDLQEDTTEDETMTSDIVVEAPQSYSLQQAIAILEERTLTDNRYQAILDDTSIYPEKLLINLANNPEMRAFVSDYKEKHSQKAEVALTNAEKKSVCPLLLQWDERWGYQAYGDNNIAISGCGPTALSMVVIGMTGDETKTPDVIADYAMNNGYYLKGTGTKWKLMKEGAIHFGLYSNEIEVNREEMVNALDNGYYLICSMDEGDFTTGGHFIVIYGYDDDGFMVNDPFCIYRSNQRWTYTTLHSQIKSIWEIKSK